MDFNLTEGQRMLQKVVREFVEREIEPIAAEIDKTGVFPSETFQKMTDLGLTGISIPEEYGGCGGTDVDKVIVVSEIARPRGRQAGAAGKLPSPSRASSATTTRLSGRSKFLIFAQ